MPATPHPSPSPLIESGVRIFLAVYRELAVDEIMAKANGNYDEGLRILESYHLFMTRDQINEIAAMQKRVEAARPDLGPTPLINLLRNPLGRFTGARRFKKICKEYKQLVHRLSQVARGDYVVFTSNWDTGGPSQTFMPVVRASQGNEVRIFVSQEVALEIERAARPIICKFCDLKISVGSSTTIKLQFTSSSSLTIALGLIQLEDPSQAQREGRTALLLAASGELAQAEEVVRTENAPRYTTLQPDAGVPTALVITLSGTVSIFPRWDQSDFNPGEGSRRNGDAVNRVNAYGEASGGRVSYGLRLDNLEFHAEVHAT